MSELVVVVCGEQINYEGLFSMAEVFRIIEKYFRLKGWDKKIVFDEEYDTPTGKYVHIKLNPYKKPDDYVRMQIRLWIYGHDLVDVEQEIEGQKVRLNKGRLTIIFDAHMQTDYRNWWCKRPNYFMIQTIMEKYVIRKRLDHWEGVIRNHVVELKTELASYLNLNKFLYQNVR